ncbi:MAG TPA: alpha/beta hydrolase [Acetobacteraceae bacterium]|nr:alpha/beta hydrolase [Acetobacteraceae bacterium]
MPLSARRELPLGAGRRIAMRVPVPWPLTPQPAWCGVEFVIPQVEPDRIANLLFCFPGGGMTRRYFDLQGAPGFSFVDAMCCRGAACVLVDHPGTGESFVPEDGFGATAARLADAEAALVEGLIARLRDGRLHEDLPALQHAQPIAVAHSMGAMLAILQQAQARPYSALALLGFTTRGLPDVLTESERQAAAAPDHGRGACAELARARFAEPFPDISSPRESSAPVEALASARSRLCAVAAMQSMLPGNVAAEAGRLDVPLFLAAGDRDLTGPPWDMPTAFRGAHDITVHVMRNTGHHPFVTPAAQRLYRRLAHWLADLDPAE